MEQFTRECLEVDNDNSSNNGNSNNTNAYTSDDSHSGETTESGSCDSVAQKKQALFSRAASMEQIYESAARLVEKTLDVEGAIVLDVSHADVLETFGAESSTSISIHSADDLELHEQDGRPKAGTTTRPLCAEEHAKLQEFFAKFPNGKISEGIVPSALRCFLPTRIQYALCELFFLGLFLPLPCR